jgi:hypothetical protein
VQFAEWEGDHRCPEKAAPQTRHLPLPLPLRQRQNEHQKQKKSKT